ncbi:MAG: ABC transporter permease subunit [Thiotrichales bacterium]
MPTSTSKIRADGGGTTSELKRSLIDRMTTLWVRVGGVTVIALVLLIFLYLFIVIAPLFLPAKMVKVDAQPETRLVDRPLVDLSMSQQFELAVSVAGDGLFSYYAQGRADPVATIQSPVPAGGRVSRLIHGPVGSGLVGLDLEDGRAIVVQQKYSVNYEPGGSNSTIVPALEFPLGPEPQAAKHSGAVSFLALSKQDEQFVIAWGLDASTIALQRFQLKTNLLGETVSERSELIVPLEQPVVQVQISGDQRWVIVAVENGSLLLVGLKGELAGTLIHKTPALPEGDRLTALQGLLGGNSWITGTEQGQLAQWMVVRDGKGSYKLEKIRSFRQSGPEIKSVRAEQHRKVFYALDGGNALAIYSPTAEREVLNKKISGQPLQQFGVAANGSALVTAFADGSLTWWRIKNPFPEVSWSSLWKKVWYEGYDEPQYLWQSSAASDDFEPKYSFVPLTFGTIKAAFYAMLVAMPLAILAAVYTGYFMSRRVRNWVKPSIEFMEALPTVILGFLAGLWLAPFMESHLPGVIALFVFLPLVMALFGMAWYFLPVSIRRWLPDGWHALLLIPVVLIFAWICFYLSFSIEHFFFAGDMRVWLEDRGIDYDQRNAMVVGLAMGFAVIPTIFSISEDAVFNVPGHLIDGSHALGATAWQTLTNVIIPTASPAIFSALMIGLGRAVGETMIVLMATGNTPIMDWNIFEGMRTLAANVAVEMPEAAVNSTHYRLLFLTAFLLLLFTFFLNSLAELVRYRLRKKYSVL